MASVIAQKGFALDRCGPTANVEPSLLSRTFVGLPRSFERSTWIS